MPIFRVAEKVVLFAHVPKCGGGSIEQALHKNGLELSFYDGTFWRQGPSVWYKSSPQHLETAQLQNLFSEGFFDYEFAVVRDPASRLLSAFNHQRRRIGRFTSLDGFLSRLERRVQKHDDYFSYQFDNHFLPSSRFIGEDAKIFYLEDGLEEVFRTLSDDLQIALKAPADRHNVKSYDIAANPNKLKNVVKRVVLPGSPTRESLSAAQLDRIRALYREDYQRFGRYST